MTNLFFEIYDADEDKMVLKEPKLDPNNFVGTVEVQMTQLVRNMCRFINIDINLPNTQGNKNSNNAKRGTLRL